SVCTIKSSSRSCVSYPSALRRNGSWRLRYQLRNSRSGPCQKTQTAYASPGRCSIRTPCPCQALRPDQGCVSGPGGNVNGVPDATYVASSSSSSRTTTTGSSSHAQPL